MTRVLVVDADDRTRSRVGAALRNRGYDVDLAGDFAHARSIARRRHVAVVVIDPDGDTDDVIAALRRQTDVPMIVVSANDEPVRRISALDGGADDFLAKPFVIEELLARVRVLLRRTARLAGEAPVITRDFVIQLDDRRVDGSDGKEVRLTPTEWRLVEVLARRPGHLVDHEELLTAVWGSKGEGRTDYLRVHMAAIRRKLEPDPRHPRYFVTVPGVGHRFVPEGALVAS